MWSDLYTDGLEAYVRRAYQNRKVKIFDFLCDHHYVDAIKWHKLPKECSVFHLASPSVEDVALLPPAGTVINSVLLNPVKLEEFVREDVGTQYEVGAFGNPPPGHADTRFLFESRVGITKGKN